MKFLLLIVILCNFSVSAKSTPINSEYSLFNPIEFLKYSYTSIPIEDIRLNNFSSEENTESIINFDYARNLAFDIASKVRIDRFVRNISSEGKLSRTESRDLRNKKTVEYVGEVMAYSLLKESEGRTIKSQIAGLVLTTFFGAIKDLNEVQDTKSRSPNFQDLIDSVASSIINIHVRFEF